MGIKVNNRKAVDDQFDRAANLIGLNDDIRDSLKMPDRELMVEVPLRKDDGSIHSFRGYRVQQIIHGGRLKAVFVFTMKLIWMKFELLRHL